MLEPLQNQAGFEAAHKMRGNRAKRDWFAVHNQTHTLQVCRRALPAALENLIFKWFDHIVTQYDNLSHSSIIPRLIALSIHNF
jgi:hypothetical protein